jgi:hypothetical protein
MKHVRKLWWFLGLVLAFTGCPTAGGSEEPEEPAAPPAIVSLTLEQVPRENSFTVSWKPEQELEGLSYEALYNDTGTAPSAEASGLPVAETHTRISSGLGGGKTYTVWVRSALETEKGPWSEGKAITLKQDQTSMTLSIQVFGETRFARIQGDAAQLQVPRNTPLPWRFTPSIALAQGASLVSEPGIGEEADFSDPDHPVHYVVKAENEREQDYTVTVGAGDDSGLDLIREPEEELLSLTSPLVLSRTQKQTRVLTVKDTQDCAWYVDGMLKGRDNGIRLAAVDYKPGVHYLSVSGFKSYGTDGEDQVPWSTELVFTVTE